MSTTLTNGLKLPDKGSVDWYADMQNNYTILDGAVGTVAEHSTQIAGKAPAVHTHTKSDITDFPVYGTTAGTICEGNDSRLSDARTPVAHTHGKADVTDLFNSANTWGGDNTWSGNQTYSGVLSLSSSSDVAEQFKQKLPKDVSTSNDVMARVNSLVDSADHYVVLETLGHWSNYVAKNITLKYKNDSTKWGAVELRLYSDGSGIFYPQSPFECDLGNSYNKWKTLNGINPGALSLPNVRAAVADPIDTVGWNLTGSRNTYTPTENGWFFIRVAGTGNCAINIHNGSSGNEYPTWFNSSTGGYATLVVPVEKGITLYVYITATSIEYCSFRPCIGNV